jgi:hypothetical protein
MPKEKKKGRKRKESIKSRLVKEHRAKIKKIRKELRELERDLRSLTGRRKRTQ